MSSSSRLSRTARDSRATSLIVRPLCAAAFLSFAMCAPVMAQTSDSSASDATSNANTTSSTTATSGTAVALPAANVQAQRESSDLPATYAGGQVARGMNFGALGNQNTLDVPFSMSAYTAKLIEDQQSRTVGDVLSNDPSVRVSTGYGNFAETFWIRGFQLNGDDVALNGLYGITPRQMVSTDALERVELFKGANAFLNGASPSGSAIGGGINLVLKHADDTPLTRVTVETSGSGELGTHIDVGRRYGKDGQFGIRFNQAVRDGTTSVQDEHRNSKTTSLGLDWRGDKVRLSADFLYQKEHIGQGRSVYYFTGGGVPVSPAATSNYAQSWMYSTTEDTVAILHGEYDFAPNWTAYISGGYKHSMENGEFASPTIDTSTNTSSAYRLGTIYQQDALSGDVGVRGRFQTGPVSHFMTASVAQTRIQTHSSWTMSWPGFSTSYVDAASVAYPSASYSAGTASNPNLTDMTYTRSVAVSDTLGFFHDRVLATVGVRHQNIAENGYSAYTGDQESAYNQSITTPLFGLVIKPTENLSLFANRSEGLSPGGTVSSTGALNYGASLAPYRSKQVEFGAKYDTERFGAELSFYQIEKPLAYVNSAGYYAYDGNQRHRGVDLALRGSPVRGVRLLGGVSLIHSEQLNMSDASNNGKRAVGVPSFQANAGVEYDLPWIQGATVSARWIYTGKEFADTANSISIPSWNRFDLGASYKTEIYGKSTTFRLNVLNVTNKSYWSSVTYNSSSSYLTLGAPRTFLMSMSTDF